MCYIITCSEPNGTVKIKRHGGIAQLGERLTGSQEVRGSIPLVSTRALNEAPTQVGAFFHIGTQGQRRHHDPPGRQDRALNGRRVHGSISRRGSRWVACSIGLYCTRHFIRALGATVSAGALHAQGWGFESLIAHHRIGNGPRKGTVFVWAHFMGFEPASTSVTKAVAK